MSCWSATSSVKNLTDQQKSEMWELFQCYYSNINHEQFIKDLSNKTYVFLILQNDTDKVVGFSTVREFTLSNINAKFIFSGDTIIDRNYWGNNSLGFEFSKYLFKQKMKSPFTKVYWNLISKGYKTYLLLANNFVNYYPNPYKPTPKSMKKMIDQCGKYLYAEAYNDNTGCIEFPAKDSQKKDCLKSGVCEINKSLILSNKKVAFFQSANPEWRRGDELVCIGEFTFSLLVKRFLKTIRKKINFKVLLPEDV